MTRREKRLWILFGGVLLFLFLLSSTDLILKEKETEIYPISVIIEDAADDSYINFRKGMERAAMEFNADVRFVTLYEDGNQAQQEELMLREQQDGSQALIVSPVDLDRVMKLRSEKRITVPVVLLNAEMSPAREKAAAALSFDYYGMGCVLGERILEEHGEEPQVYLIREEREDRITSRFQEGILSVLEPAGSEISVIGRKKEELQRQIEALTEELSAGQETGAQESAPQAVFVALDPVSLSETARILAEREEVFSLVGGLYGRGTAVPVLNYLDKGIIRGLCVTDDFSMGYLSVKEAVELAGGHSVSDMGYLDSHYIQKEDLRKETYEKMLYPIE